MNVNPIRRILLEYKWRRDKDFSRIVIHYIHRGVEGGLGEIRGEEIVDLDDAFIYLREAQIPLHRVVKITYEGKIVFERKLK